MFYGRLTVGAMWFAGSGLTMVFVAFLNVALNRGAGRDRLVKVLCYAANLLTLVFGGMIVFVTTAPQVIFGLGLILVMTTTAFLLEDAAP